MAINLNVDKYGAQFQEFVDLATRNADENMVVCVSEDRNKTQEENRQEFENRLLGIDGTPRTITAKTDGDSKGKVWRDGDSLAFTIPATWRAGMTDSVCLLDARSASGTIPATLTLAQDDGSALSSNFLRTYGGRVVLNFTLGTQILFR